MSIRVDPRLVLALLLWPGAPAPGQTTDENLIRAAVVDYFAAQASEDTDRVLGFWSADAAGRPTPAQLAVIFQAGDDKYTVTVSSVAIEANTARAKAAVHRARTITRGAPNVYRSETITLLTFARESGGWKIVSERSAVEDVADAIAAADPSERARLFADPGNNVAAVRQAVAARASRLAMVHDYETSQALYEAILQAARSAHDQRDESETLHNIANAFYFQRDFVKAAEYYQMRLALARETKDDESVAASMLGLATTAYTRGEYTAALNAYREALTFYERTSAHSAIGSTLIGIGNVQYLQAEYEAAAETYRRALPPLQAAGYSGGINLARAGLARVLAARGDVASALQVYQNILAEADGAANAPDRGIDRAAMLESIGELHYRLGNVDQARAAFDEARRISDERGDFVGAGRVLGDIGLTELIAGKFEAALAAYTESRGRYEKAKTPEGVARAWVGVGFSLTALEKYADAIAAYNTAIRALDAQKLEQESARAWLGLSMAQSGAGESAAALESARHVRRAAAEKELARDLKWRSAVREGEVLRKLDRLDEARHAFEDALGAVQELMADVDTSADAHVELEGSDSAWAGLCFTRAQQGDAKAAIEIEETRRGHLRRLFLAPFERDIVRGMTADEQDQELQNTRDLISARAQVRAERSAKRPDPERLAQLRNRLDALVRTRLAQHAALYTRLPDLKRWRGVAAGFGLADINQLLIDADTVAVEYVVLDDELMILTAAHGELTLDATWTIVPIKRRDLVERVTQAVEPASLRDQAEWRKRSATLVSTLIAPIAARLEGRTRYIVVPDDVLWKLPFEALPMGETDLAARASVSYATSLVTLLVQRGVPSREGDPQPGAEPAPPTLGAIAGPDVAAPLRAQLAVTSPGWSQPDPAASIEKARRLAALYESSTIASGGEATVDAARRLAAASDILHIDAPFRMSAASPLFSSVLLAGTGDAAGAGRWELREWFDEPGRARVLVLPDGSSFNSPAAGLALDALAWAAAVAGVSTVAIGRWPSDGFANDALLAAWHERLAKHPTAPATALRDATAAVRAASGSAPSGWAGIRLIGVSR